MIRLSILSSLEALRRADIAQDGRRYDVLSAVTRLRIVMTLCDGVMGENVRRQDATHLCTA